MARRFIASLAYTLLLAVLGCGGQSVGTLAGTVTYHGKPVPEGEVQIQHKEKGTGAVASLANGSFAFAEPMPAGTYLVSVVPPIPVPVAEAKTKFKDQAEIPKKARDMKTSGLTVEVKPGANDVVTIVLKE